jgi:dipeptidyl aminopeptidase/acylaminoacyl peptidase
VTPHPSADVPDRLFDDPELEHRWRARFRAARVSVPDWARNAPDRCVYSSNASGTWEIYAWDRATDTHRQVTDRPSGTHGATVSPDGDFIWWFDDTDGDEFGRWVREPFGGRPPGEPAAAAVPAPDATKPEALDGYSAGLEIGVDLVVLGVATDEGSTIWISRNGAPATVVYQHAEDAGVGALSHDETLLAISHSEHGDSRHPSIRVLRVGPDSTVGETVGELTDGPGKGPSQIAVGETVGELTDGPGKGPSQIAVGETVGELADGPGKGLSPIAFPELDGDTRLLVNHERRGRDELLIWDVRSGEVTELEIDLPGDLSGDFYPDGTALLIGQTHAGRSRLHRYVLADGALTALPTAPGCVGAAGVRPDGTVEYGCSSAAVPPAVRALDPDGSDRRLLTPAGEPAPGSVPVTDAWVRGPGGDIHALVAYPDGEGPFPTLFSLHGGPHSADEDRYSAVRAAWVDAGFAVVEVNYRGSTGYGSAWRDAIEGRPGLTELADVAAVQDWAVASGLADPARCVVNGWSWGGYLTLLALGTQPQRWAAGVAGVPVADYLTAYADEMEQLRAFDRALFGGSPDEVHSRYVEASPLTYVDAVRAPVLVLAGENDPRCPIQQVDNYLDALAARGFTDYQVLRFDAGHGSLVVDQTVRHTAAEIAFCLRLVSAE